MTYINCFNKRSEANARKMTRYKFKKKQNLPRTILMIIGYASCSFVFLLTIYYKSFMWGYYRKKAIELHNDETSGIYLS